MNRFLLACFLLVALASVVQPAVAQGKSKRYPVTTDRAIVVAREVLVKQGFELVRVEGQGILLDIDVKLTLG